jgi:hypothetical protein
MAQMNNDSAPFAGGQIDPVLSEPTSVPVQPGDSLDPGTPPTEPYGDSDYGTASVGVENIPEMAGQPNHTGTLPPGYSYDAKSDAIIIPAELQGELSDAFIAMSSERATMENFADICQRRVQGRMTAMREVWARVLTPLGSSPEEQWNYDAISGGIKRSAVAQPVPAAAQAPKSELTLEQIAALRARLHATIDGVSGAAIARAAPLEAPLDLGSAPADLAG